MNAPPWLKKVLREIEAALVLLVDVEAGRAPAGGFTFDEQRSRALQAANERLRKAVDDYERQSATLPASTRKRAATWFGVAFALSARVAGEPIAPEPDRVLGQHVRRFEQVCN